ARRRAIGNRKVPPAVMAMARGRCGSSQGTRAFFRGCVSEARGRATRQRRGFDRLSVSRGPILGSVTEATTRSDVLPPNLPFSAGIRANGFVFTAGQVGTDPHTGQVAGPDVASQTRQTIANLKAVLEAGGSSLDKLVKTTVFLADLRTFD